MFLIWLLIPVIAFLLVAVLVGTFKSAQRLRKTSNIQKSADKSYRKTNGTHAFNYAVKKFSDSTGARLKIIIVAETNFSDFSQGLNAVNTANSGKVTLKGAITGKESVTTFNFDNLEPNMTVKIPTELLNQKLHVCVETDWTFGNYPLEEKMEFDID